MAGGLKAIMPEPVRRRLAHWRMLAREKRLARLDTGAAFDEIYRQGMWRQGESLSGPGSEGAWARRYIELVSRFVREQGVASICDAGCGDFSVGRELAPLVTSYAAVDVSEFIIERNRTAYANLANVDFRVGDLTSFDFPKADLVLVRQVLQHLTNAQIEAALGNLQRSGSKWILVAEDVTRPERMEAPNMDMASHSMRTRTQYRSGVVIAAPPFNRAARRLATLEPGPENRAGNSVLAVDLIDNRA